MLGDHLHELDIFETTADGDFDALGCSHLGNRAAFYENESAAFKLTSAP
jgi:hypothetical protein